MDKASIIRARVCETVECLLQSVREDDFPVGVLQVLVGADFLQLVITLTMSSTFFSFKNGL